MAPQAPLSARPQVHPAGDDRTRHRQSDRRETIRAVLAREARPPGRLAVATDSPLLERLKAVLAEVADLYHAQQILEWDARVSMPHAGAEARADVASTVTRLAHGRFASDEVGKLLEDLQAAGHDPDSVEGALIRITRREWERASRIPSALAGEMVQSSGVAVAAWDDAKAASEFEAFRP